MLSRSSFSIRRLISQRRPPGYGNEHSQHSEHNYDEEGNLAHSADQGDDAWRASRKESRMKVRRAQSSSPKDRSRSWRATKNGTKKSPQPTVIIRRSGSIHRIDGPLPPLPDTPHSSTSSLCSCDRRRSAGSGSTGQTGNSSPALCPPGSKTTTRHSNEEIRSSSSSTVYSGATATTSTTVPNPKENLLPHSRSPPLSPQVPRMGDTSFLHDISPDSPSTANPLQGPPLQSDAGSDAQQGGWRTPRLQHAEDRSVDGISENIRQLILETDEAFKAVGVAISEAKMASQSFPSSHGETGPNQSLMMSQSGPMLEPRTFVRRASISKTKRRRSRKARRRDQTQLQLGLQLQPQPQPRTQPQQPQPQQQHQRRKPAQTSRSATRRTLSENVSELLHVRLFHRIEADEMLTPSQLQELKQNRVSRLQTNQSSETLRTIETDGSETPIEPFHLEDLPSRIAAAGVRLSIPSPIAEAPTPRSFGFGFDKVERTGFAPGEKKENADKGEDGEEKEEAEMKGEKEGIKEKVKGEEAEKEEEPTKMRAQTGSADGIDDAMTFQNLSFPTPPLKNPRRKLQPRRQLPPLPSIPEAMAEMQQITHTDEYVRLPSSPFTVTMPSFLHGPIRFSKADLFPQNLVPDETLDWTAFQMAILGGAGDFFSDSVDFTRMADAEEADMLAEWFEGFGLEGAGRLVDLEEEQSECWEDEAEVERMLEEEDRRKQGEAGCNDHERKDERDKQHRLSVLDIPTPPLIPPSPAQTADMSPISSAGSTASTRPREMVQIQSLPIPIALGRPAGFWSAGHGVIGRGVSGGYGGYGWYGGLGIERWNMQIKDEQHQQQQKMQQAQKDRKDSSTSEDSLPQSPMFELVVNRGVDGDEYIVPMGYNLGHDLGDFLQWESQNVYAAGFFGA